MVYTGYDDEEFYDHFDVEFVCLLGLELWPLRIERNCSTTSDFGNPSCQSVFNKVLSSSSSSSLAFDEFSNPCYYFVLVEELNNGATCAPTVEETIATITTPVATLVVAQPTDNNNTLTPPSNDLGISRPLTIDKHAKINELGLHKQEGISHFMSIKDNLLDVQDTSECSLDVVDLETTRPSSVPHQSNQDLFSMNSTSSRKPMITDKISNMIYRSIMIDAAMKKPSIDARRASTNIIWKAPTNATKKTPIDTLKKASITVMKRNPINATRMTPIAAMRNTT